MTQILKETEHQFLPICQGIEYTCINDEYNYADNDCVRCKQLHNIVGFIKNTKYNIGLSNSFGLMWSDPDTNERIYITTDCQYSPEASMRAFYQEADHIFHDCETSPFKSGVHANYTDLKTLPADVKKKMWLYHYQDNVIDSFEEWNKKAIEDGFRGFVKTGAVFGRTYASQEGGFVGNIIHRNALV